MLKTHEEANNIMSCPMFRGACRGAGCMAWRWGGAIQQKWHRALDRDGNRITDPHAPEPKRPPEVAGWEWEPGETGGEYAGWREPREMAVKRRKGFCGLAGEGGLYNDA